MTVAAPFYTNPETALAVAFAELRIVIGHVEESTDFGDTIAGEPKQVHYLQFHVSPGGLVSPPRPLMGSMYSKPAGDVILLFDYGVHLAT